MRIRVCVSDVCVVSSPLLQIDSSSALLQDYSLCCSKHKSSAVDYSSLTMCIETHTHIIADVLTTELDKPMGQVVTPLTPVNISPDKRERSGKVLLKG